MTTFTFSDGVAIGVIVYYVLCLPLTLYVCFRHGTAKASGWRFLLIFSIIRIVGSAAQLATITQGINGAAEIIAAVASALGVSPLLLASLGLVSRLYYSVHDSSISSLAVRGIRLIQIACAVGLILCIVGATRGDLSTLYDQTTLRVGIIIFGIVWVALVLLVLVAASAVRGKYYEKPLLIGLAISLPILLIRVCFSLYRAFGDRSPGSALADATTSEFLSLFLGTIEEMAVVLIYVLVGLRLAPLHVATGTNTTQPGAYA